jgi:hypothetical protein
MMVVTCPSAPAFSAAFVRQVAPLTLSQSPADTGSLGRLFLPLARSGRRFLGTGVRHDPATTVENMSRFSRLLCRNEN